MLSLMLALFLQGAGIGAIQTIIVQDEATDQCATHKVNFAGTGVVAACSAGVATVTIAGGGGSTPTGTGFTHITGGVQDAAAKTVAFSDVDYSLDPSANPAMAVNTCFFTTTGGEGFVCEGTAADANEYRVYFPAENGEVTKFFAIGDSLGAALDLGCTNCIGPTEITDLTLGTDTAGNYVASHATGLGLSGGAAGSEGAALTTSFDYSQTLAGNPALGAKECIFQSADPNGGFICEGTTANTNEQRYLFPSSDGADTDNYFALGDSAGAALSGDSATSFFSTGTLAASLVPAAAGWTYTSPDISLATSTDRVGLGIAVPDLDGSTPNAMLQVVNATQPVIGLGSTRADAAGVGIGVLDYQMRTNSSTFKRIAAIGVTTEGATANQRGGKMSFYTQSNAVAGLVERASISEAGTLTAVKAVVAPNIPVAIVSTSTASDAVIATYTAVPGMTFVAAASTRYIIDCYIIWTSTAATTGINFAWDYSSTVTQMLMTGTTTTTTAGAVEGFSQNSDAVGTNSANTVVTAQQLASLHTIFTANAGGGNMALFFTPETANSVSVIIGSVCTYSIY